MDSRSLSSCFWLCMLVCAWTGIGVQAQVFEVTETLLPSPPTLLSPTAIPPAVATPLSSTVLQPTRPPTGRVPTTPVPTLTRPLRVTVNQAAPSSALRSSATAQPQDAVAKGLAELAPIIQPSIIAAPIFVGICIVGLIMAWASAAYLARHPREMWHKSLEAAGVMVDDGFNDSLSEGSLPRPISYFPKHDKALLPSQVARLPVPTNTMVRPAGALTPWEKRKSRNSVLVAAVSRKGFFIANEVPSISAPTQDRRGWEETPVPPPYHRERGQSDVSPYSEEVPLRDFPQQPEQTRPEQRKVNFQQLPPTRLQRSYSSPREPIPRLATLPPPVSNAQPVSPPRIPARAPARAATIGPTSAGRSNRTLNRPPQIPTRTHAFNPNNTAVFGLTNEQARQNVHMQTLVRTQSRAATGRRRDSWGSDQRLI
ncbi:uncharacterized protein SPPG_04934 [Spizellomyces punctatus DAOM BR117]|uniref:Transmembrane protein n=1 Tax=Spizellomyces punctatus (strain DAOM BR117) TaxID=645134 RepID=A0A0L0HDJ3_SPIPD|nr:uncharacterized protein SPPG_04934 [Spizellomyces punctatus DAOM BR117]KNC99545.1 hypothetical protein SPPG_04934 [Spizellomyces punctatus DAOM BR117]|eukprot:XP_016607585.1 hypothetical protein SPPG_04934 [Spizellomyces punctatus DAOM BR117]